jgi:hypothetical protein
MALYYLKGLSITPNFCIAKMHITVQQYTTKKTQKAHYIIVINCNIA